MPDPVVPGGKRENPVRLWAATQGASATCDLVVVHFGDFARDERENERSFLLPAAYRKHRERALLALDAYLGRALDGSHGPVLLVVPTPPLSENGSWNRLTPFLSVGVGHSAGLISDTTQTPGLIAARDIAPTLLAALDIPQPLQMTGAPARTSAAPPLARLDRLTRLNQQAQDGIFWTLGLGAAAFVFGSLGLYLSGRMAAGHVAVAARYGVRFLCAWPPALLLAPLTDPHSVGGYLAVIVGMIGLLALLPTPQIIFGLTALVLVGDGLTGTTLVSNSALSEYALAGIRFYGIGNEYMGVLIGGALLACAGVSQKPGPEGPGYADQSPSGAADKASGSHPQPRSGFGPFSPALQGRVALALWFALVTFVLSFPAFGAKAGGAVTATATLTVAWQLLRGKAVTWRLRLGGVAAGFALVLLWAALGHVLHLRRTHLETAVGALGHGRFGYILGVSLRKIGLAARVAVHPGALAGLLGFALLGLTVRKWLWRQVSGYLATRPRERAVWRAGIWGCLVALLFNDSGIVAAILILQCLVLSLLHGLFGDNECASSGWTSATSASASPSATP